HQQRDDPKARTVFGIDLDVREQVEEPRHRRGPGREQAENDPEVDEARGRARDDTGVVALEARSVFQLRGAHDASPPSCSGCGVSTSSGGPSGASRKPLRRMRWAMRNTNPSRPTPWRRTKSRPSDAIPPVDFAMIEPISVC